MKYLFDFKKILLGSLLLAGFLNPALASDVNWHAESKSYEAYLGVVPVLMLKKQPYLIDRDIQLHGGLDKQDPAAQHIMVSLFRKSDNQRVLNATLIARVKAKKLIGGTMIVKPLEKMLTGGVVTYGNYFSLPDKGEYVIEVEVYEPNKNGNEQIKFMFKKL